MTAPNVLRQLGSGAFPWCVRKAVPVADGFVEVRFKPQSGREDRELFDFTHAARAFRETLKYLPCLSS